MKNRYTNQELLRNRYIDITEQLTNIKCEFEKRGIYEYEESEYIRTVFLEFPNLLTKAKDIKKWSIPKVCEMMPTANMCLTSSNDVSDLVEKIIHQDGNIEEIL